MAKKKAVPKKAVEPDEHWGVAQAIADAIATTLAIDVECLGDVELFRTDTELIKRGHLPWSVNVHFRS